MAVSQSEKSEQPIGCSEIGASSGSEDDKIESLHLISDLEALCKNPASENCRDIMALTKDIQINNLFPTTANDPPEALPESQPRPASCLNQPPFSDDPS